MLRDSGQVLKGTSGNDGYALLPQLLFVSQVTSLPSQAAAGKKPQGPCFFPFFVLELDLTAFPMKDSYKEMAASLFKYTSILCKMGLMAILPAMGQGK